MFKQYGYSKSFVIFLAQAVFGTVDEVSTIQSFRAETVTHSKLKEELKSLPGVDAYLLDTLNAELKASCGKLGHVPH